MPSRVSLALNPGYSRLPIRSIRPQALTTKSLYSPLGRNFFPLQHNGICPRALSWRLSPKSADDYIMAVPGLRLLVAENAHALRTGQP
jgi:hypothetical protein